MAVLSGVNAKVMIGASNVMECQRWSWSRSVNSLAYASCSTGGYKKRVAGTKDHNGSIGGLVDDSDDLSDYFDEGDLVTLLLYINTTDYYSVPAMIEEITIEANNDDGDLIPWDATFGGNGAWSSSGI